MKRTFRSIIRRHILPKAPFLPSTLQKLILLRSTLQGAPAKLPSPKSLLKGRFQSLDCKWMLFHGPVTCKGKDLSDSYYLTVIPDDCISGDRVFLPPTKKAEKWPILLRGVVSMRRIHKVWEHIMHGILALCPEPILAKCGFDLWVDVESAWNIVYLLRWLQIQKGSRSSDYSSVLGKSEKSNSNLNPL